MCHTRLPMPTKLSLATLAFLTAPATFVAATNWTRLGALFTLVIPLYVALFTIIYRLGKLEDAPDDIDSNVDDIETIRDEIVAQGQMISEVRDMMAQNRDALREHRDRLEHLHDDHVTFQQDLKEVEE